jgi:hypothetical protein
MASLYSESEAFPYIALLNDVVHRMLSLNVFAFNLGTDQTRNSAKLLFLLRGHRQALLGFRTMATRCHTIAECSIKGTNVMYVPVHLRSDHRTFPTLWKDAQVASVDCRAGSTHE